MFKTITIFTVGFIVLFVSHAFAVAPWEIDELMGNEMPAFSLKDVSGNTVSQSALKGKVGLINFWATWCEPCKVEMPSMNNLFMKLKDKGFLVLAVSIDDSDEQVKKFVNEHPVDFPVLRNSSVDVAVKYKVFAYPTTFLIDRKGIIRDRYIGESDWLDPKIIKAINKLLDE